METSKLKPINHDHLRDIPFDTLVICNAYESGYGHGITDRGLPNPYNKPSLEHGAWNFGYSEGRMKLEASLK